MVTLLVGTAVAVGILGTLVPVVPGIGLVWTAALIYGILEGFGLVGWMAMAVITGLAVAGLYASVRVPQRAASIGGIPLRGQLFAVGLAVVGFFAIPVVGAAVGFVAGIYLVARRRDPTRAGAVTVATLRAMLLAAGLQFVAAMGMGLTWLVWVVV